MVKIDNGKEVINRGLKEKQYPLGKLDLNWTKDDLAPDTLEDDDCVFKIKKQIDKLPQAEKNIWYCYVEIGTYAGVARYLKSSTPTAKKIIDKIRRKILDY